MPERLMTANALQLFTLSKTRLWVLPWNILSILVAERLCLVYPRRNLGYACSIDEQICHAKAHAVQALLARSRPWPYWVRARTPRRDLARSRSAGTQTRGLQDPIWGLMGGSKLLLGLGAGSFRRARMDEKGRDHRSTERNRIWTK